MFKITMMVATMGLVASLVLAAPAMAQDEWDCADFDTQAQAQSYAADGDPYGLDEDSDGKACEDLPSSGASEAGNSSASASASAPQFQYSAAVGEQYGGPILPATGGPNLVLLVIAVAAILIGAGMGVVARRYSRR
jgi:hypothetical protein